MNKKIVKILSIILLLIISLSISTNSFAAKAGSGATATEVATNPGELQPNSNVAGSDEITNLAKNAMGVLQTVGIVLSVLILIVLGIKYMMGSAEEKAEYKKTMIPYLVGAALIFGASVIANVVFQFFSHL